MELKRVYDFCLDLQKAGVWTGVTGSCDFWDTRAKYFRIYDFILKNFPERPYGYRAKVREALNRVGGGYSFIDTLDVQHAIAEMEREIYV